MSQEFEKVYFNSNWIIDSKDHAEFYRMSEFDSDLNSYAGTVTDYLARNNQIEMTGFYKNGKKDGPFLFYYPSGNVKMRINFQNGERTGIWTEYYENGIIKLQIEYKDPLEVFLQFNDSLGLSLVKKGKIIMEQAIFEVPSTLSYFERAKNVDILKISGKVKDNLRNGKWKIKLNDERYGVFSYKNGVLRQGLLYVTGMKKPISTLNSIPLIADPRRFKITEMLLLQPGARIKNNYATQGRHEHKYLSMAKKEFTNHNKLKKYIQSNCELQTSKKVKGIKLDIVVKNGVPTKFSTTPTISKSLTRDLELVIGTIEKITFINEGILKFEFLNQ